MAVKVGAVEAAGRLYVQLSYEARLDTGAFRGVPGRTGPAQGAAAGASHWSGRRLKWRFGTALERAVSADTAVTVSTSTKPSRQELNYCSAQALNQVDDGEEI